MFLCILQRAFSSDMVPSEILRHVYDDFPVVILKIVGHVDAISLARIGGFRSGMLSDIKFTMELCPRRLTYFTPVFIIGGKYVSFFVGAYGCWDISSCRTEETPSCLNIDLTVYVIWEIYINPRGIKYMMCIRFQH